MPSAERFRARAAAHPTGVSGKVRRVLRQRWDILLVIAVGGIVGSLGRWAVGVALPHRDGAVPWSTAVVNVGGCLAIGALMAVVEVAPPSRYLRPFLGTGVLGGFTTFSAYMLDTRVLLVAGQPVAATSYLFGSLAGGFTAVWLGAVLARAILVSRVARVARTARGGRGVPRVRAVRAVRQVHDRSGVPDRLSESG